MRTGLATTAGGDLREGGRWTAAQRLKNDVIWLFARVTLAVAERLPLSSLRAVGRSLGLSAHALLPAARGVALANVERVFPGLDARGRAAFVRRCFSTLGELLGESVALLSARSPPPIPVSDEARALFAAARAEGRGVVFASAHLGPWERVAASLVAADVPLVTIARESYDPRFSRLYERLRSRHGVQVLWRARPGTAAGIVRTLRAGGVLGVPMDLRSRVPCVEAPFLGHDAPTPVGPARVALRTGAAVIVGTVTPAGDRAEDGLVITATRIPTEGLGWGPDGVWELTRRMNAELSGRILAMPHGWVWMHERWRGETSVCSS
jgi:KDO2-lipid IV(A) lauroyltransferase